MTARLTPRGYPERTLVVGGVRAMEAFYGGVGVTRQEQLMLVLANGREEWFTEVAEIELDDAPGDWWS